MELSWTVRSPDGEQSSCEAAALEAVTLCWQGASEPGQPAPACDPARSQRFPCTDGYGATAFEVAPGRTLLWVEPICAGGAVPGEATYQVPPPIARDILSGEVASLGAILIVATDAGGACPATGCTCAP